MRLKKGMSYSEIFDFLTENGYKFGREKFEYIDLEYKKVYTYYNSLPTEGCWLYHPNGNSSLSFSIEYPVEKFILEFNNFELINENRRKNAIK